MKVEATAKEREVTVVLKESDAASLHSILDGLSHKPESLNALLEMLDDLELVGPRYNIGRYGVLIERTATNEVVW